MDPLVGIKISRALWGWHFPAVGTFLVFPFTSGLDSKLKQFEQQFSCQEECKNPTGYLGRTKGDTARESIKTQKKARRDVPPELNQQGKELKNPELEIRISMLCPEYAAFHQDTSDCAQRQLSWWLISFSQLTYCFSVATERAGITC